MTRTGSNTNTGVPAVWTVLSLVEWAQRYLAERGFDEARLHAELLLGHVLSLDRLQVYLQFDRPLTANELAGFKVLFKRRLAHEPLQYILGETSFMGLPLAVGPGVLIPRPETESLVEQALAVIRASSVTAPEILDVGTGAGTIAIALAHALPSCRVTALDVSPLALAVARQNVERNGVTNVRLLEGDFPGGVDGMFDMIVTNPPYVSRAEYETLAPEIREFEPRGALTDEADGLEFFRKVFAAAPALLKPGGDLLCEIGAGQEDAVAAIARERGGWEPLGTVPDLAGIPRVFHARLDVKHS